MKILSGSIGRLIRSIVSVGGAAAIAHYQNNDIYIALAPALTYISKKLHDRYPGKWDWLPF